MLKRIFSTMPCSKFVECKFVYILWEFWELIFLRLVIFKKIWIWAINICYNDESKMTSRKMKMNDVEDDDEWYRKMDKDGWRWMKMNDVEGWRCLVCESVNTVNTVIWFMFWFLSFSKSISYNIRKFMCSLPLSFWIL